jgi:glucoamylase
MHVGKGGWSEVRDRPSQPIGLGMHGVRFDQSELAAASRLSFTRFYPQQNRWEGEDHAIELVAPSA